MSTPAGLPIPEELTLDIDWSDQSVNFADFGGDFGTGNFNLNSKQSLPSNAGDLTSTGGGFGTLFLGGCIVFAAIIMR